MSEDTRHGHVPADLIYGPVQSRRFGCSLGVSLSAPGLTVCHWRCPYCQLGDWPFADQADWPAAEEVLRQLAQVLASTQAPQVITVAGGGEPTDHPDFAAISAGCRQQADACGARLLLLSNGDGLDRSDNRQALVNYDDIHLKWDPGPRAGSWRPGRLDRAQRLACFQAVRPLHLQVMVYQDPRGGNSTDLALERFFTDMRELKPDRIHLGTIDRDPRLPDKRALTETEMASVTERIQVETGVPVQRH
jgi:wyosine [tRNA(Phe)-imidazoG37] synthetase (radical SAM superfamily)